MALKLYYITNNPEVALIAEKNGVDRIFVDLESLDKELRQQGMDTVKSHHTPADVKAVKSVLTKSELIARVNHWNDNSQEEIDAVIDAGADIVMLPYWKSVKEVENFIKAVAGRAKTMPLLETKEAFECLPEVLKLSGLDEMYVGLNDLSISYGFKFMFEPLANGIVEKIASQIKESGIPFGFGGIASLGQGMLPAEKIVMEHYRLGSTRVILSRSFCDLQKCESLAEIENLFTKNVKALREYEESLKKASASDFEKNKEDVKLAVESICTKIS